MIHADTKNTEWSQLPLGSMADRYDIIIIFEWTKNKYGIEKTKNWDTWIIYFPHPHMTHIWSLRPVGLCGPTSVAVPTTALGSAPEWTQALSSPEPSLQPFKVRPKNVLFILSLWFWQTMILVLFWDETVLQAISIFFPFPFRMWNIHGHHDRSGRLQLHLPMVWSAGLSH